MKQDSTSAQPVELLDAAKWAVMEWRLHGQLTDSCRVLEAAITKTEAAAALRLPRVEAADPLAKLDYLRLESQLRVSPEDRLQPIDTAADNRLGPITLNTEQERQVKKWAADDRLWTTQETVEINLRTFARIILRDGARVEAADPLRALIAKLLENNGGPCGGDDVVDDEPDTHVLVRIEDFKALGALLAAPVASAWQSIASMDKHGGRILIAVEEPEAAAGVFEAIRNGNYVYVPTLNRDVDLEHVRGWQPLPLAPVASAEEDQ